jgi:hypothetical protein
MNVGKALFEILSTDAGITAICSTRVYPEIADQDAALPFIVYKVSDINPSGTKSGSSSLDTARVDVYCVADEYGDAMDLSDAARTALDRVGGTYNSVAIQSIDFDTADVEFDQDQRAYIAESTYNVRVLRVGQAPDVTISPLNLLTVEEADGDPTGAVNKLVVSNGTLTIAGNTATIDTGGGADVQYHDRYSTEAESERSGATATLEIYYTARPDGDGYAESEVSDVGETDTINRTLYYSDKFQADPDTAGDWTQYTTQPADNATFATAKAALLAGLNDTDATAETRGTLPLSLKMVRTTTAPATDLLLDSYTGAAAAYSVRKLDKDYTGYCMKVRRASDDAEADIGFDSNGDLDTAAIASHCGASAGYCSVWYDMSGNGNNATQSTLGNQPQIYNGTAVITENGKPAIDFDGTNDVLTASIGTMTHPFTVFTAAQVTYNAASFPYMYGSANTPLTGHGIDSSSQDRLYAGSTLVNSNFVETRTLFTDLFNGSSSVMRADGSQQATGNVGTGALTGLNIAQLTNYSGSSNSEVKMQEIVIWNSDQTSNFTGIESDINTYFSIFTP